MTSSLFHVRTMSLALTISVLNVGLAAEVRADDWNDADHKWDQIAEGNGNGGVMVSAQEKWGRASNPELPASGPITTAGDDTTRQSNTAVPASEAGAYFDFAHCALE